MANAVLPIAVGPVSTIQIFFIIAFEFVKNSLTMDNLLIDNEKWFRKHISERIKNKN